MLFFQQKKIVLLSPNHCPSSSLHDYLRYVDECESAETNECHPNASCNNTEGSYTCRCLDGYEGDGKNCTGK